jgi:hypothetical protein
MLIELLRELLFQIPAISHLGGRVQKGKTRQLLGSLSHCPLSRVVIEDLDRTYNFAVSAPNRTNTNLYGNSVATLMAKVYFCPMGTPVRDGFAEWAVSHTEEAPRRVNVHQEVVGAAFPHDFLGAIPGKVFRRVVPVRNPTVSISEVDTIQEVV